MISAEKALGMASQPLTTVSPFNSFCFRMFKRITDLCLMETHRHQGKSAGPCITWRNVSKQTGLQRTMQFHDDEHRTIHCQESGAWLLSLVKAIIEAPIDDARQAVTVAIKIDRSNS